VLKPTLYWVEVGLLPSVFEFQILSIHSILCPWREP
jgi:hypothetical protein